MATIALAIAIAIVAIGMQFQQIKSQRLRSATGQGGLIYSAHLLMLETAAALAAPEADKKLVRRMLDERREILGLTLLSSQLSLDPETITHTRSLDEKIRRWIRGIEENKPIDRSLLKKMYISSRDYKHALCKRFVYSEVDSFRVMDAAYERNSLHIFCVTDKDPYREKFKKWCTENNPEETLCKAIPIIDFANQLVAEPVKKQ